MAKVSIIIPARNERFLSKTIDNIMANVTGEIEVIAMLDACWADPLPKAYPNLTIIHTGSVMGMRANINAGARIATGKYLMKCDGHCAFDKGFDEILQADCEENWLAVPSRYSLDGETWERTRGPVDYLYLTFPYNVDDLYGAGLHGRKWKGKGGFAGSYWYLEKERKKILVDDLLVFQGSCWFMHKDYFFHIDCLDTINCYNIHQESTELTMKVWLSGGRVIRNKKTWYAHLHKGKKWGRGFRLSKRLMTESEIYSADYWMNNRWPKQIRPIKWLIDKFGPLEAWPEDWDNPKYSKEFIHPSILKRINEEQHDKEGSSKSN